MAKKGYTSQSIEVLSGLDPVRKRPGMYTDTTRPNHLVQEVVDNSIDEVMNKHATVLSVTLDHDGAIEVSDNGRGMPVDIHPEYKVSGIELILTRLHSGAKFSEKEYRFAGGLHGVGVSVVNALSKRLEVWVKRDGRVYHMAFEHGDPVSKLAVVGKCPKNETGTRVKFFPDPKYFDSPKISVKALAHLLQAKAVLCPGLLVHFEDCPGKEKREWCYEQGLRAYLLEQVGAEPFLGDELFEGVFEGAGMAEGFRKKPVECGHVRIYCR